MEILVNDNFYSNKDFKDRIDEIKNDFKEFDYKNRIVALCIDNPFELLSLITYFTEEGASLFLLHSDIPEASARKSSLEADSSYLIFQKAHNLIHLKDGKKLNSPSLLQMSSGTSNVPKIIRRKWSDIDIEISSYNEKFPHSKEDQVIILASVTHSYGLITGVLASLQRNLVPKIVTNKNPKYYIKCISEARYPLVYAIPFYFNLLDSFKNANIKYSKVVSSGAPLTQGVLESLNNKSELVIQQYGCTEIGCISFSNGTTNITDMGSPLKHLSVSIKKDNKNTANIDYGEIVINNGINDVCTNDYGYISDSGSIHILNRMDDLINVSGQKVLPSEVESIILSIKGIKEAVVYRGNHKVWGECVKSVIVCDDNITESYIKNYCNDFLPKYKIPTSIKIVKDIPKTHSGKISRKLILEKESELDGSRINH